MLEWAAQNWLALYAAIVGTIALLINFSRFLHSVNRDKVKIRISVEDHPRKQENIDRLKQSESNKEWERTNLVEIYSVTIRNVGTVEAYLKDVGIITSTGETKQALTSIKIGGHFMLTSVDSTKLSPIPPKDSISYSIYLKREQPLFKPRKAFAIDSTGKKWLSKKYRTLDCK